LFVGFYKYGDSLLGVMANPFYLDIGFTKAQIGIVSKTYGVVMTLAGTALGGVLVARKGILKTLLLGGVLQAASNLTYSLLAWSAPVQPPIPMAPVQPSLGMFALTIAAENLSGGLASAAFVAYLSSLCNLAFTATQYALLSSLAAFVGKVLASGGGWLADHVSWTWYFALTTLAAVPGLALLIWMIRRYPPQVKPEEGVE
ncbi:MAG: AmpG family muropeptide MFS transporter, partial [Deltaproteobacteria bacterium]|nr:AmpG family muropeptide MFS transporter [Deltaproteobacteria bacterium]